MTTSRLPVCERWFTTTPHGPGVSRIHEPHVDELVQANFWHVRGRDRDLVIDCGLGVGSLRDELPELFEREPVLVLTHAHLDHMGSAHEFTECWAHMLEPVEQPPPGSLHGPTLAAELGLQEALAPLLISALPHPGYLPGEYRLRGARVTRRLRDGDPVELGDRTLRVLHLPGHSPGGISLWDEHDGTLFSGDVIYDDILLDAIAGADPADYRASLRRLRELPVRRVHPGHGPSFDGVRLRELIDGYLSVAEVRR